MCGIAGILGFGGVPVDEERVAAACRRLRHRGPDCSGTWRSSSHNVALGSTRLAVLDPAPRSRQPMHRNERFHLVFNGEIYNYRAIRDELVQEGEAFSTEGDTEVVLASLARWGHAAFQRFNGMWALAFHDSHNGEGFLARDRFGIKPLCYAVDPTALRFASELGPLQLLLGSGDGSGEIDEDALVHLLQFGFVPDPLTILRRARRLEPGCYLRFDRAGAEPPKRYDVSAPSDAAAADTRATKVPPYAEARKSLRRVLADAVTARRVADVPIGAFLSGGLDSSIIVAELARASGRPVKTFSVGFLGHRSYDETHYARLAAERFHTDHHEIILTPEDVLAAVPRVLDHLSEPVGDSSIIPTSLVSAFARQEVTVAMSGDGGDELFGGYWRYLGHAAIRAYRRLPTSVRTLVIEPIVRRLASGRSSTLRNRVRQWQKLMRADSTDPSANHVAWCRVLAPEAEGILRDSSAIQRCTDRVVAAITGLNGHGRSMDDTVGGGAVGGDLARIMAFDLRYQLPGDMLQKVDLASMMHSLEVRVPFLDHRVVKLAESLPTQYKLRRGLRKRILIDAYRGEIPDAILDRPKQGFEAPIGELLRGPLREMFLDTVTRRAVESFGSLHYDGIVGLLDQHRAREADHAGVLFALLSLCWWRRKDRQATE